MDAGVLRYIPSLRALGIATASVLAAVGLYGLARETSMFAVQTLAVEGASPALAAQVRSALQPFEGESLVAINAGDVADRVEAVPAVRTAIVDRAFPHTLRVRVVPEVPVAVLRRGEDSFLVSARGRVTGRIERGAHRELPRIWLPVSTEIELGSTLADASGALAARSLSALVGSHFPRRIVFVRADDGQLTFGLQGGLEVRLGAPVDVALKIAVARAILPTLAAPAAGGPRYLDVAVPERPVAGTNPQPEG